MDQTEQHEQEDPPEEPRPESANGADPPAPAAQPGEATRALAHAIGLHRRGRLREAGQAYLRVLAFQPDLPEALTNFGSLLRSLNLRDAAIAMHRRALAVNPDNAAALCNLGNALRDLGQLEEAFECLRRAFAIAPETLNNAFNLGLVLRDLGHLDEALGCFERVLAKEPEHVGAHWDRALTWLLAGRFREGLDEYEWRWRLEDVKRRELPGPEWDGSPQVGKTILLYPEQGFGDTIQFARYAPLVKALGMRVVLECNPRMVDLMETLDGPDRVVSSEDPLPEFDTHAPLLSLPRLFGTTLETVPAEVPYLAPPERRRIVLHDSPSRPLKVGIAWAGKPTHRNDHNRSCRLVDMLPLIEVPGTMFYSLQWGPRAAELARAGVREFIHDVSDHIAPFSEAAGVMAQLDLMITVDTVDAHLAGALGKETFVLMPAVGDWRWMLRRNDSPWYPTLRLFRQREPGDWAGVVARAAAALKERAEARHAGGSQPG